MARMAKRAVVGYYVCTVNDYIDVVRVLEGTCEYLGAKFAAGDGHEGFATLEEAEAYVGLLLLENPSRQVVSYDE